MEYGASCHCGNVAVEFDGEIEEVLSCNCSIRQRKGSLLWFLPRDQLELITPEDAALTYHVPHARDPAPVLPCLRYPPVRRGSRPPGQTDGGDQRALHRRDRSGCADRQAL